MFLLIFEPGSHEEAESRVEDGLFGLEQHQRIL